MKNLVLLIDDNWAAMKYYRQAIAAAGFEVQHIRETDQAIDFAAAHLKEIMVVLLDCMMPAGKRYQYEDTGENQVTGLLLFRDLQRECPELPVVILTNVKLGDADEFLRDAPPLRIVAKVDCSPSDLVNLVREYVIPTANGT